MHMYQDDSLSSLERKRMRAFMGEKKRLERLQRSLMLKQVIDQEAERINKLKALIKEKKRQEIEEKMNEAATKI